MEAAAVLKMVVDGLLDELLQFPEALVRTH